jgi:hypothetical protein
MYAVFQTRHKIGANVHNFHVTFYIYSIQDTRPNLNSIKKWNTGVAQKEAYKIGMAEYSNIHVHRIQPPAKVNE